jgi:energy-coupling factor transporter transmembrane protein EcfT
VYGLRGYGSKNRTYLDKFQLRFADWVALVLMIIVAIAAILLPIRGYGWKVIPSIGMVHY